MRTYSLYPIVLLCSTGLASSEEAPVNASASSREMFSHSPLGDASPRLSTTLRIMSFNIWCGGDQVSLRQVANAIQKARADIVGIQEPEGCLRRLADLCGLPFVDERRNLISKFPLFDPDSGIRHGPFTQFLGTVGLLPHSAHAWALVHPGHVVAIANVHLDSDPYGPAAIQKGSSLEEVLRIEDQVRLPDAQLLVEALKPLLEQGVPLFLTGDLNTPSGSDWTLEVVSERSSVPFPVAWPVPQLLRQAGLRDSYREVHPDPLRAPGYTWTPGYPHPICAPAERMDRIDYIWTAGPTMTKESFLVGETGNDQVQTALWHYPADHRAVVSTFQVTPIKAPPLICVVPSAVRQGEPIALRLTTPEERWSLFLVSAGEEDRSKASISLSNMLLDWRNTIHVSSSRLEPGLYDALLCSFNSGQTLAKYRFEVRPPQAQPQLWTSYADHTASVHWKHAPGWRHDWLALYRAGCSDLFGHVGFYYTGGTFEGSATCEQFTLQEHLLPGEYEIRLFADDSYVELAHTVCTTSEPLRAPQIHQSTSFVDQNYAKTQHLRRRPVSVTSAFPVQTKKPAHALRKQTEGDSM